MDIPTYLGCIVRIVFAVCCWGTLSEQFSKLSDSIFFESMDSSVLYVNQVSNHLLCKLAIQLPVKSGSMTRRFISLPVLP
jgi:hypothetical protein